MRKVDGYDNATASQGGDFEKLPAGGYVCKIKSAQDVTDKEYLKIEFDIADGKYRGWFSKIYERANFWGGNFIRSYKDSAIGFFKGFMTSVQESNSGYTWNWQEQSLVGKSIGLVLAYEEYNANDGTIKERIYVAQNRSVSAIRANDFVVPDVKRISQSRQNQPKNEPAMHQTNERMPWDPE